MEYASKYDASAGVRMRQVRRAANMTQEKLADLLGISVNYLGEVERGHKPLSRSLANQFCTLFNVTFDYLFHGIQPAAWQTLRENCSYESVHTSVVDQLDSCSPDELMVISQLIRSYLDVTRFLQRQNTPKNFNDCQNYAAP